MGNAFVAKTQKKLTERNRLQALRLLDDAVQQLHLVQRCLSPAIFIQNGYDLLAERLQQFVMDSQISNNLRGQVGRGVNGGNGEDDLRHGSVEGLAVVRVIEPVDGIVELERFAAGGGLGLHLASIGNNRGENGAGFGQEFAVLLALRQVHVGDGAVEPGVHAQVLCSLERDDCVLASDAKPVFVAAKLSTNKDARRDSRNEAEDGFFKLDIVKFYLLVSGQNLIGVTALLTYLFHL